MDKLRDEVLNAISVVAAYAVTEAAGSGFGFLIYEAVYEAVNSVIRTDLYPGATRGT